MRWPAFERMLSLMKESREKRMPYFDAIDRIEMSVVQLQIEIRLESSTVVRRERMVIRGD